MGKKAKAKRVETIEFLENQLENNVIAIKEYSDKKQLSLHDLKPYRATTEPLRQMIEAYTQGQNILGIGSGGTGKSSAALYLALSDVLTKDSERNNIILVRSAVPGREVGFLTGNLEEKIAILFEPYKNVVADLTGKATAFDKLVDQGVIQLYSSSYLRSISWHRSVIIIEEIQNMNLQELATIVTRAGHHSKIIAVGDIRQDDLIYSKYDISGVSDFIKIIDRLSTYFTKVIFRPEDILRSGLTKAFTIEYENYLDGK